MEVETGTGSFFVKKGTCPSVFDKYLLNTVNNVLSDLPVKLEHA